MEGARRRQLKVAGVGVGIVAVLVFMYVLRAVFNPFLLALALAYIFNPVVDWMESRHVPRKSAVVLIFLLLAVICLAVVVLLVPVVFSQMRGWYVAVAGEFSDRNFNGVYDAVSEADTWQDENGNGQYDGPEPFIDVDGDGVFDPAVDTWTDLNNNGRRDTEGEPFRDLNGNGRFDADLPRDEPGRDTNGNGILDPGYIHRLAQLVARTESEESGRLAGWLEGFVPRERWERFVAGAVAGLQENLSTIAAGTRDLVGAAVEQGWAAAGWLSSLAFLLLLTPIYMGFFLFGMRDGWDRFVAHVPGRYRARFLQLAYQIDIVIGAFFRGRLLVCLAIGAFTATGFLLCGVPFGLLFGIAIGIASFIPFLNVVPLIFALLLAWVDGVGGVTLVVTLAVYGVGQGIDPLMMALVVGKDVQLHPVTILLSLFVCSALFGFFGMLLAVPIVAVGKILFREFLLPHLEELAHEAPEAPEA